MIFSRQQVLLINIHSYWRNHDSVKYTFGIVQCYSQKFTKIICKIECRGNCQSEYHFLLLNKNGQKRTTIQGKNYYIKIIIISEFGQLIIIQVVFLLRCLQKKETMIATEQTDTLSEPAILAI